MREGVPVYAVVFLFMSLLVRWFGTPEEASALISASLLLLTHYASRLNIPLRRWVFRDDVVKPFVLRIDKGTIYEEVRLSFKSTTDVLINFVGGILPLGVGIASGYVAVTSLGVPLPKAVALTTFLTVVYARITQAIRGRGLGVPLAKVLAVSLAASLAVSYGLEPRAAALITYSASAIATFVGIDVVNLPKVAVFRSKRVIIGGLGFVDAVFFLPALTTLLTWSFTLALPHI